MAEPESAAPETSGTAAAPVTMQSAFESALQTLEQGTGADKQAEAPEATPEETPEGTVETPAAEEPEHIKWVKSIDGDFDKDKGEIIVDRVAKRAFELNRQSQALAQRLNQLDAILQHPEMQKVLAQMTGRVPAEPKKDDSPQGEKTEEQILEEWFDAKFQQRIKPLVTENQAMFQKYAQNQMNETYTKLKEEFGNDDSGRPMYDSVREEIGRQIQAAAAQANIPVQQMWNELIRRDLLYPTLSNAARSLLYPKLKERVAQVQAKSVQDKKKVHLPVKGTAPQSVKPAEKKVSNILEAARQAEEQYPEFKELA